MNPDPALLDERSTAHFRHRFGTLARRATSIDVAATRVRLSLVDLSPSEIGGVTLMRVLLAEVNAVRMAAEAEALRAHPERRPALDLMAALLREDRIQARSAPMGGWSPDFSVFSHGSRAFAALVGVHSFLRPDPLPGPLFVSEHGPSGGALAAQRFEELWAHAHDVSVALLAMLRGVPRTERQVGIAPEGHPQPEPLEIQRDIGFTPNLGTG